MAVGEIVVIPVGAGQDMRHQVRAAVEAIERHRLRCQVTALGTNVEGELDEIFTAARAAYEACLAAGAPRAVLELRIDHRLDRPHGLVEMQEAAAHATGESGGQPGHLS